MRAHAFLRRILGRQRAEADQAYFETRIEQAIANGLTREEAQRVVWVRAENPVQVKEQVREARMGAGIEPGLNDIRYASRILGRNPDSRCSRF